MYHLFAFIPLSDGNELHEAIAETMNKNPLADAMVNATVDYYLQWWDPLYPRLYASAWEGGAE